MKKYHILYATLLTITTAFFPVLGMKIDLSQSIIGFPEESMQQPHSFNANEQIISFEQQINNLSKEKHKIYKPALGVIQSKLKSQLTPIKTQVIDYSLKMINNENIGTIIQDINQQKITLNNKINILSNLYNLPNPIPFNPTKQEWKELVSWKNNKKMLKKELNLKIEQNYKKQDNAIAKKQKENANISIDDWKKYQKALEKYNNIIPENATNKADIAAKLKLVTFMAKPTKTIQDLQEYKENLEKYLIHLQSTPETQKKYQETIEHINLINTIDEQMQVDYTHFNTDKLFSHMESLSELRRKLHNVFSERYEKLNNKIQEVTSYYYEKIAEDKKLKEKLEKEGLEEEKRFIKEEEVQKEGKINQDIEKH